MESAKSLQKCELFSLFLKIRVQLFGGSTYNVKKLSHFVGKYVHSRVQIFGEDMSNIRLHL